MSLPILSAVLALSAAASWGSGDFTGGMVTRRVGSFFTILISYAVGLVLLVVVALARHEGFTSTADLVWGALAGVSGMIGLGFLFRGFAAGRMGIVAPVSAVLGTTIPVIFTAFTEGLPNQLQLMGFGLALLSIWLLSRPERFGGHPAGIGLALLAGLGFGGFFTLLNQVGENAIFWPLVSGRVAACGLMALFALATRRQVDLRSFPLGLMALAGLLDAGGNLFFLLAIQMGRLDVAAVLGSLYPAVTAILAWLVARERLASVQVFGLVTAVLAIVLITT